MLKYLVCNFMLGLYYRHHDGRGFHRGWCTLKPTLNKPLTLNHTNKCDRDDMQPIKRVQFQGFEWCINN